MCIAAASILAKSDEGSLHGRPSALIRSFRSEPTKGMGRKAHGRAGQIWSDRGGSRETFAPVAILPKQLRYLNDSSLNYPFLFQKTKTRGEFSPLFWSRIGRKIRMQPRDIIVTYLDHYEDGEDIHHIVEQRASRTRPTISHRYHAKSSRLWMRIIRRSDALPNRPWPVLQGTFLCGTTNLAAFAIIGSRAASIRKRMAKSLDGLAKKGCVVYRDRQGIDGTALEAAFPCKAVAILATA